MVIGDQARIRQVPGNLVANVLRHTPAGSPFEVAIGVSGDSVVAQVIDHGPGLPPDAAARVFERFYRGDYGRARTQAAPASGSPSPPD